jgi:hypothetical protein
MNAQTLNAPVWEGDVDFGNGERRYRCLDISSQIGLSIFEYLNPKLGWRRVQNHNTRRAMHNHISGLLNQTPF